MSDQEIKNPLASYGEYLIAYTGTTKLNQSGFKDFEFKFETRQLNNGSIIIWLSTPTSLSNSFKLFSYSYENELLDLQGTTNDGWELLAQEIRVRKYFTEKTEDDENIANIVLGARQMTVTKSNSQHIEQLRFGITNFLFEGRKSAETGDTTDPFLPISLQNIGIEFHPNKSYTQLESRLGNNKGIEVTCEAHITMLANEESECFQIIDDICFLISVLRGCLINWIYCLHCDIEGNIIKKDHQNRITKPYGSLALIHDSHAEVQPEDTKNFIERTFEPYPSKRDSYKLNKGAIYAYLAAKAEGDLLESRGVKVAVAIEMLKDLFLKSEGITRTIMKEKEFNKLRKKIQSLLSKVLEESGLKEKEREKMYKKIGELNNKTFEDILLQFLEKVQLNIQDEDIKRFIRSRNSLVHTGQFYCETATESDRKKVPPHKDVREEYFFLLNFIDKIFLKFLNYDGPYIDRSYPIGIGTYKTSVSQP